MAYVPTWKERLEEAKVYRGPAIAGVVVLVMAGWLGWHFFGPEAAQKPLTAPPKEEAARLAAVERVAAEVTVLENTYRRAVESGASEQTTRAMLDRVIAKQRERMRLEPTVQPEQADRLARLEGARGSQRSRTAQTRSAVLEEEARALRQEGRGAEALEKLREALRLQSEANANAAAADVKDLPRESRLAAEIAQNEAEPLRAMVATALALARSAVAQENWDNALKAFTEARAAQAELNQRYPATRFSDLPALDRIDAEIESLRAAGLAAVATAREREGDAAAKAGRAQEAAASYAAAAAARREVNEKFARSRFASEQKVDELEVQRQTVLSGIMLTRAAALETEAMAALRRRQNAAGAEKIAAAAKMVEKVAAEFPRSRALNPALQRKLAYLALRATDLDSLQDAVLTRVAAVPGVAGAQMLKTEVTQELYQRVMNANPSRNQGRALPVDSVSWLDAREFCERLSWLLGRKVRLPTEGEYRAAAGELTRDILSAAWSAETTGGRSRDAGKSPATTAGFHDVAGNLAEWLQPATEVGETAPVVGGSYLDTTDGLIAGKTLTEERRVRARHIGFRVVVEAAVD